KEKHISIKQRIINSKLEYFLRLFNFDPETIMKRGNCNGLGFLKLYYTDRQKRTEFFQCLATISSWDGTIKMAQDNLPLQHLSGNYKSLKDLLTQWSNDVVWFQQSMIDPELKKINTTQNNRIVQYDYLKKDDVPMVLKPFIQLNQQINVNMEQLH